MKLKQYMKGLAIASTAAVLITPLSQYDTIFSAKAVSGLCINEVCAKNTTYAAPDGGFYDWIELYNPTNSAINLSGYGITDKETNPYRFTFPSGASIGAGQHIIVFFDSLIPTIDGAYTAEFGLSTSGETIILTNSDGAKVDSITFGAIAADVSYGRITDGSDEFAILSMSPNAPNEKSSLIEVDVPEPIFSHEGGFYDSSFDLDITHSKSTRVYYTLDGSVPTTDSNLFTEPIKIEDITSQPNNLSAITNTRVNGTKAPSDPVDKAMTINAIAVDDEGNVSDVVTAAYFIGYNDKASYYNDVKIISITTDADNLFDDEKGIYVLGNVYENWRNSSEYSPATQEWEVPANYTQKGREWERSATIQVYDGGKLVHSQGVGIRIHGGATRSAAQKSFNVYTRADYGATSFDYDLFDGTLRSEATGKKIKKFDSFILRNAGNDSEAARFRDKLNQSLVSDRDMLTQGMVPCIVFINGEFWGQYEITEKLSDDYIESHYNVNKKDVCLIKNNELEEGDAENLREWEELYDWVKTADMSQNANYERLCSLVDMQSFADYMSAQFYLGNKDFAPNNTAMWKTNSVDSENQWADGRWRFILFDTEYSTGLYGSFQSNASNDIMSDVLKNESFYSALLKSALKNDNFKQLFVQTFMDLCNENYNNDRVTEIIDNLSAEYHDMVVDTLNRFNPPNSTDSGIGGPGNWGNWGIGWGTVDNESTFTSEVNTIKSFYRDRTKNVVNFLRNNCGLQGNLVDVTLNNDTSMGTVMLNTITPTFTNGKWVGSYYTDYPINVNIEPIDGVEFSYWDSSNGKTYTSKSAKIEISDSITLTTVYGNSSTILKGDVNLDQSVNVADLVTLSKWLLGSSKELPSSKNADVCSDGVIDVFDLVSLRKIIIG